MIVQSGMIIGYQRISVWKDQNKMSGNKQLNVLLRECSLWLGTVMALTETWIKLIYGWTYTSSLRVLKGKDDFTWYTRQITTGCYRREVEAIDVF